MSNGDGPFGFMNQDDEETPGTDADVGGAPTFDELTGMYDATGEEGIAHYLATEHGITGKEYLKYIEDLNLNQLENIKRIYEDTIRSTKRDYGASVDAFGREIGTGYRGVMQNIQDIGSKTGFATSGVAQTMGKAGKNTAFDLFSRGFQQASEAKSVGLAENKREFEMETKSEEDWLVSDWFRNVGDVKRQMKLDEQGGKK